MWNVFMDDSLGEEMPKLKVMVPRKTDEVRISAHLLRL
jgi:hypothetical protein